MRFKKFLFVLAFIYSTVGCRGYEKTHSPRLKPPSGFTDTLVIENRGLIAFRPSPAQVEALLASPDSTRFESLLHDHEFMLKAAVSFARSAPETRDFPITEASEARYLLFIMRQGDTLIDLDNLGDLAGLFYFDPRKEPRLSDMANIASELPFFFSSGSK